MLSGGAQWSGIDDSVVKRIAEENGKTNVGPTFNLQGDLLLFAFLMAGIGGGFLLGYYYRQLFGATPTDKGSKDV
ncbi:MAG: cobalt transporter [Nitrospinae bacterium]|nr:cobalt transporter [Nitrospinota bacterium]